MTDDQNLPMSDEIRNIGEEAQKDLGFQKMLKFNKGDYICDKEQVPLGTKLLAHTLSWTKTWIHFEDKRVVERRNYIVGLGQKPPDRSTLPNNDQSKWAIGINGHPADPWVLQYMLPMEDMQTGDVQIFITSSRGGKIAVGTVCDTFRRRAVQMEKLKEVCGQPIITLQMMLMATKNFGDVKRPHFEIVGWDDPAAAGGDGEKKPRVAVSEEVLKRQEMDDEIPF